MDGDHPQGGLNPLLLKKAKLRGILLDHGVEYASNAKKAELVDLYLKHVAPPAKPSVIIGEGDFEDQRLQKEPKPSRRSKQDRKLESPLEKSEEKVSKTALPDAAEDQGKGLKKKKTRKHKKRTEHAPAAPEISERGTGLEEKPDIKLLDSFKVDETPRKTEENKAQYETPDRTQISKRASPRSNESVGREHGKLSAANQGLPMPDHVSLSASRQRKRRSMLEEIDLPIAATPLKGNVFEVDSESEPEVLSSRRKKQKRGADQSFLNSLSSPISRVKPLADPGVSGVEAKMEKHASEPASAPPVSQKVIGSNDINEHTPSQKKLATVESKVEPPVLQEIVHDEGAEETSTIVSELTEEPSLWFKSQLSFQVHGSPHFGEELDSTASATQNFDSALSKLKKETRSQDVLSPQQKKEELAKLFNIDINSIKPKKKGARSITPRRPIVIPLALLARSRANSPEIEKVSLDSLEDELSSEDEDEPAAVSVNHTLLSEPDVPRVSASRNALQSLCQNSNPRASLSRVISYLVLWLGLVSALLFGYWYREQTFLVGYCGQSINRRTVPDTPDTSRILAGLGEYLDNNFKPECVECPQHARCFPRLEVACYDDFVVSTPWYYPYVPNFNLKAQKCIPDTKKAEKIEIMIDVALDLLRARNANENCGRSDADDTGAGLHVSELHDLLLALKAPYITEEEFEELWERSVVELEKEPEIIVRHTNHLIPSPVDPNDPVAETYDESKVLRSTSLSHVSLKCMMSNTILSLALRFKKTLAAVAALCAAVYAAYWKYQQYKLYSDKVDTLYHEVLSKLKRQARLGRDSRELPKFIGSVQLRDLILSSERNLSYKMRLWQAVSHKVDRNTNVKHELLEVHGEVMKVWQWISNVE